MTDEAISPSRRRMIEDMTVRKFAPKINLWRFSQLLIVPGILGLL